jgi:hypothetical protein
MAIGPRDHLHGTGFLWHLANTDTRLSPLVQGRPDIFLLAPCSRPLRLAGLRGALGYKRFRTAAGAIRFAIEQLPKKLLLGASLEVGDERYNEAEIRQLYDSEAYPLKRHARH